MDVLQRVPKERTPLHSARAVNKHQSLGLSYTPSKPAGVANKQRKNVHGGSHDLAGVLGPHSSTRKEHPSDVLLGFMSSAVWQRRGG